MASNITEIETKVSKDKITKIGELSSRAQQFLCSQPVGYKHFQFKKTDTINTVVAGRTPLTLAAGFNNPEIAMELLQYPEIDINHVVPNLDLSYQPWGTGENALATFIHYFNENADISGVHFQVIKTLIEKDPKMAKSFVVPFGISEGDNLFILAAMQNSPKLLQLLIDIGIDTKSRVTVDCNQYHPKENHGEDCHTAETALHIAVKNGAVKNVEFLLDSKADVNATNLVGLTALDRALGFAFNHKRALNAPDDEVEKLKLRDQGIVSRMEGLLLSSGAKKGVLNCKNQSLLPTATTLSEKGDRKTNVGLKKP